MILIDANLLVYAELVARETKADLLPDDAHLAALAIEHGLTLCSTDRDFARFEGLRWTDPLRDAPAKRYHNRSPLDQGQRRLGPGGGDC